MLKIAAAVLLSIPLLLAGVLASTGLLVVDVKPSDGPRILVPVPMILARAAVAFVPSEMSRLELGAGPAGMGDMDETARKLVAALREAEDGILVEVEDRDEHVLVEKIDDEIAIEVMSQDQEVSVRIPLQLAEEVLDAYDGERLSIHEMVSALGSVSRTDLVHVKSREEEVKIWVW